MYVSDTSFSVHVQLLSCIGRLANATSEGGRGVNVAWAYILQNLIGLIYQLLKSELVVFLNEFVPATTTYWEKVINKKYLNLSHSLELSPELLQGFVI